RHRLLSVIVGRAENNAESALAEHGTERVMADVRARELRQVVAPFVEQTNRVRRVARKRRARLFFPRLLVIHGLLDEGSPRRRRRELLTHADRLEAKLIVVDLQHVTRLHLLSRDPLAVDLRAHPPVVEHFDAVALDPHAAVQVLDAQAAQEDVDEVAILAERDNSRIGQREVAPLLRTGDGHETLLLPPSWLCCRRGALGGRLGADAATPGVLRFPRLQRLRTFVFAADAYVVRFDVQYAMHANDTQRFEHAGRFTRRAADGHAVAVNLQQEWARLVGV